MTLRPGSVSRGSRFLGNFIVLRFLSGSVDLGCGRLEIPRGLGWAIDSRNRLTRCSFRASGAASNQAGGADQKHRENRQTEASESGVRTGSNTASKQCETIHNIPFPLRRRVLVAVDSSRPAPQSPSCDAPAHARIHRLGSPHASENPMRAKAYTSEIPGKQGGQPAAEWPNSRLGYLQPQITQIVMVRVVADSSLGRAQLFDAVGILGEATRQELARLREVCG